jgi:hypothetical protein
MSMHWIVSVGCIEWVCLVAVLVAKMGLVADMSRVAVLVAKMGLKWP